MNKKTIILFLSISLFICGCAGPWQVIKKDKVWQTEDFKLMLPKDWVRYNLSQDILSLTKDGLLLQNIQFFRYRIGKDKLLNTKKKFTKEMLLQEAAEMVVNELMFNQNLFGVKVLENKPVFLDGVPAFRLTYTFHNADDLPYRVVRYGVQKGKYFYFISYKAAQQYYFDKDIELFDEFIKKIKIL